MSEKETTRIVITSYQCRRGSYDVTERFRLIRHPKTGEVMSEELTVVTVISSGWMTHEMAEEMAEWYAGSGPAPKWLVDTFFAGWGENSKGFPLTQKC